ncbi:recombinase family protein [Proteobacteria bacterium 005FR1]|nr:recombinase family protein [Proteobacteria bacterium 005FR1]
MSLIGYARVSTKDQDLGAQMEALEAAGCVKVFHGKQSGKSDDNQAKLREMLEYVREGDTLILTKLDRLGRSLSKILFTIEELQSKGVAVRTLDGQVDTTSNSPMQKAMTQLLGVFAELEHSIIVDRLQSGRERTGRKGGRAKALTDSQIQLVRKLFSEGASKAQLSTRFSVSRATIMRALQA